MSDRRSPVKLPSPASRRTAAFYGTVRWATTLIIGFVLLIVGYYVYVDVINRAPADVYVVQRGTAIAAVYGTVTVTSTLTLNVNAQNTGYMHLAPGFGTTITSQGIKVEHDQLLATVVDEVGQRALAQAKTDYEAALARQKLGPTSLGALKSAQDQLDAYEKLPDPRMVAGVVMQAARNQVSALHGAVDNERLELQRLVDTDAGVVKADEDTLKRTEVRAPTMLDKPDGKPVDELLTSQVFNDNSYVTSGQVLFTLASTVLYISGEVNEEDVGKLKPGMKAEMHLYAYGGTTFTATVTGVLPSPDANSSRYTVLLVMDHPPDNLLLGLTGEMNIILGRKENALVVPARALLVDQVQVVKDGVIQQRTVETGFKSLEYAEITQGLQEGDQVVVADQDTFVSGQRVRAIPINDAKASSPKK
jgi:RND family efflux transporter MFP subunit